MKNLLILGAGTAGTMMANHLHHKIGEEWKITLLDQYPKHYYQPGFLFIPFGQVSEEELIKPKRDFIPRDVEYIEAIVDRIDSAGNQLRLESGKILPYDILIVATGSKTAPERTEGLLGSDWRKRIFDFYTLDGAIALREPLKKWKGGRLVVHISRAPFKCPVAPIEFTFMAEQWLTEHGLRDKTELIYVTPFPGLFIKPNCGSVLGSVARTKNITMIPGFNIARVDNEQHKIVSKDGVEVPYDLLVEIPTHIGDAVIERSGLGNELNFVPTDPHTLQSKAQKNIFVIGDAADLMVSKSGSVAHFESSVLADNILRFVKGEALKPEFDGHVNCFIESGYKKALLIDYNYDLQPMPGTYPIPGVGPFSLLKQSRLNHLGKLALPWIYWHRILKARPLPGISSRMSRAGKIIPTEQGPTSPSKM